MLFLYDKIIGDLPDDFYSFKQKVHEYFPKIYDTKYISTVLTKQYKKCNIEKTNLDNVYKNILKNKFDIYVDFFPDAPMDFAFIMIAKAITCMMLDMILLLLEEASFY